MNDDLNTEEFIIRPMQYSDIEEAHRIDEVSFSLPWSVKSYQFEVAENPSARPWVAGKIDKHGKQEIVAMAVFWLILDELHLATIAVHPDFRKKGLGRKLLATALLDAVREGAAKVYLEVRRSNVVAQALYQTFGFKVVGNRPRYYRDNNEDAVLMTLEPIQEEVLRSLLQ